MCLADTTPAAHFETVIRHTTIGGARLNPPLSYMSVVDDADAIAPFNVGASDKAKNKLRDLLGVFRFDPEEQNSGPRLLGTTHSEFAEVPIKSHNEPVFAHCSFDVSKIGCARAARSPNRHRDPRRVERGRCQEGCFRQRGAASSGARPDWQECLVVQSFSSKGEDSAQHVVVQLRIVALELILRPAFGKEAEHEIDRKSCSLDDGLATEHAGIGMDMVSPSHIFLLIPKVAQRRAV